MTEPTRDLVDRTELRRKLKKYEAASLNGEEWLGGRRYALRLALDELDAMPPAECPRGWTRDEVLHEMDTHPGAVCEWQNPWDNDWRPVNRHDVDRWHPEVRRYDVRVVLPSEPVTVWVPLTKLVGRTLPGETEPVICPPVWTIADDKAEWRWLRYASPRWLPFPVGTLNLETGLVEVLAEGDA